MASASYPPQSMSSTPERAHNRKWWGNAKQLFLRPWRRRERPLRHTSRGNTPRGSNKKRKKGVRAPQLMYTPRTWDQQLQEQYQPLPLFPQFSPFANISPVKRPFSEPPASTEVTPASTFDPNPPYKSTRPSLFNVFPMYDTPKVVPAAGARRHLTPSNMECEHDRRPSVASTSSDRSEERRQRRTGAIRALPVLPKRDSRSRGDVEQHSTSGSEISSHHGPSRPRDYTPRYEDYLQHHHPPLPRNNFAYPNWPPIEPSLNTDPFLQLRSIEEEDNDEIKGFDEFMMY